MGKADAEATVTAGNASGQNDGAAVCIVTTPEKAAELGLRPLARLVSWASPACRRATMGIGPVPATAKALAHRPGSPSPTSTSSSSTRPSPPGARRRPRVGVRPRRTASGLNVNGSGISLGHPVGATGGRILATLLREMDRREARYGLETMCIGGGQGLAAVFERVA